MPQRSMLEAVVFISIVSPRMTFVVMSEIAPCRMSSSSIRPRVLSIGAIISSSDNPITSCSTYIIAPAKFHKPRRFSEF